MFIYLLLHLLMGLTLGCTLRYVRGQAGMVSNANQGFNSNAGFVVTSEGVVVFDALGSPALGKRLSDLIANTTKQPVRRIIDGPLNPKNRM